MQSDAKTVPAYLKSLDEASRKALAKLRALIRKAAPDAKESMQYRMPTYDLNGAYAAFASQMNNLALYVCDVALVEQYKTRIGKVNCGKSCIRFKKLDDFNLEA